MTDIVTRAAKKLRNVASAQRRKDVAEVGTHLTNKVLVGTHHKTGTVWVSSIFARICQEFRLKFFAGSPKDLPGDFQVFFQDHSRFNLAGLMTPYRGLHLIRDPRDVIVSGCFYHQCSEEPWLHVKQKNLGGLSYAEKINSYPLLDDRILFEMEHVGLEGIQEMLNWNYATPDFFEVRYEDLIADSDLMLFHRIFLFLGFPGKCIPELLEIAYAASIFSGNVSKSVHVRSGKARQWEQYFNPRHKSRFVELFGDALVRLGYEESNDWASV
jgi:hypothetical protein